MSPEEQLKFNDRWFKTNATLGSILAIGIEATVIIRRTRSTEIRRGRNPPNDGTANGSAGVNSAPDLGGQRCGIHENRGDSTGNRHPPGLRRAQSTHPNE
jgi:hypothetical protein